MSENSDQQDDQGGSRLMGTIGGALAVIAIVALGVWLADEMSSAAKYSKCAAARHRNCDAIDYRKDPPPQQ